MSSAMLSTSQLLNIQRNLYRYGGPIIMFVGTISCIIGLLVFSQKHLRKNTCSIYFIAINFSNLCFIYTLILFLTLPAGFDQPDIGTYSQVACRLVFYVTHSVDSLNSLCIILASVDRVLITSSNPRIRRLSTPKVAWISLSIGSCFWLVFHIHAFISTGISQIVPGFNVCVGQGDDYNNFVSYYFLLVKGIIIPTFMGIFGLWTMKNIRNVRQRRVGPMSTATEHATITNGGGGARSMNSKDRHFALMLVINLSIYLVFNLPLSIGAVYLQLQPFVPTDLSKIQENNFIRLVCLFSSFVPHCLELYENLITSKTFRSEVMRLFKS